MRLRLTADGFDVYAIGLEKIPHRDDWIANTKQSRTVGSDRPVFVPTSELEPHLIEKTSIKFGAGKAQPTPVAALRNERTRSSAAGGRRLRSDL
jgi:hypothetical protein